MKLVYTIYNPRRRQRPAPSQCCKISDAAWSTTSVPTNQCLEAGLLATGELRSNMGTRMGDAICTGSTRLKMKISRSLEKLRWPLRATKIFPR